MTLYDQSNQNFTVFRIPKYNILIVFDYTVQILYLSIFTYTRILVLYILVLFFIILEFLNKKYFLSNF